MSIYFISCIDNFFKQLPFIYEFLKLGTRSPKRPLMSKHKQYLFLPFIVLFSQAIRYHTSRNANNTCATIASVTKFQIKSFKTYLAHGCGVGSVHQLG
jgi:hypothetical protein